MKFAIGVVALVLLVGACPKKSKVQPLTPEQEANAAAAAKVPPGTCDYRCLNDNKCKTQILKDELAMVYQLTDVQLCRGICMGYEKDRASGKIAAAANPCVP